MEQQPIIIVVAALICKDGQYLLAKRSTGDADVLGKWEFPGGKVNSGEDEKAALEREIREEFELQVRAGDFLTNCTCKYPTKTVDLRLYACEYVAGDFHLHAHSEYRYVNKNTLLDFDLCPADQPLAKFVKENL